MSLFFSDCVGHRHRQDVDLRLVAERLRIARGHGGGRGDVGPADIGEAHRLAGVGSAARAGARRDSARPAAAAVRRRRIMQNLRRWTIASRCRLCRAPRRRRANRSRSGCKRSHRLRLNIHSIANWTIVTLEFRINQLNRSATCMRACAIDWPFNQAWPRHVGPDRRRGFRRRQLIEATIDTLAEAASLDGRSRRSASAPASRRG